MSSNRDEKVKTLRILEIDRFIREGNYPNCAWLGKHFEVSRATIMRDMEFLRDRYLAPVEYDSQKNGYYYSDPTFFIKSVMLSEGELFTVSTVLPLLEQYRNTPLEASFKSVITKITAMLPDEVSVDSSFLTKEFSFISDPLPEISEEIFINVFKSVKSRLTLIFDYRNLTQQEYSKKSVDPYHVVCQKGNWYIIARDNEKDQIRVYALSRMKNLTCTETQFNIPEDFSIEKYIDEDYGIWINTGAPMEIELLFEKSINTLILEKVWHKTQTITQNKDGTVLLKFKSNQKQEVLHWIMGFGSKVKVLNPPELIETVKSELKKAAELY